jgi:hypothetical protein
MRNRLLALAIAPLAAGSMLAATVPAVANAAPAPATTTAAARQGSLVTSVTGTIDGALASGTLTVTRFVQQNGQIFAVGNLVLGGTNFGTVQVPVNAAATNGTCQILHLDLGPLDLTLLGLHVHLNEVVLDITAQQGPGNLLGNLLCAVAGLLDNTGTNGLATLLNQILAILSL